MNHWGVCVVVRNSTPKFTCLKQPTAQICLSPTPSLGHFSCAFQFWKCAHNLFFAICLINSFQYACCIYVVLRFDWMAGIAKAGNLFLVIFSGYEKCSYLIFELCIYSGQIINQICALFQALFTKLPLQQMSCTFPNVVNSIYKWMIYKRLATWKRLGPFDKNSKIVVSFWWWHRHYYHCHCHYYCTFDWNRHDLYKVRPLNWKLMSAF